MKILARTRESDIANVFVAELPGNRIIEFVESRQPPIPRDKKWVFLLSTLAGCPIGCKFCDCSGGYKGKLSKDEIFAQADFLTALRYPDKHIPVEKFKIQFARMGEPALNPAVLDVLEEFPSKYDAPGFLPSLSTIAPVGRDEFFNRLLDIKKRKYSARFQLQFSLHTSSEEYRKRLIPAKTWGFKKIASYGESFFDESGRKITLNFAFAKGSPFEPKALADIFNPEIFLIKITPLNPAFQAAANNIKAAPLEGAGFQEELDSLKNFGYEYLVSIGEMEENAIGSNCGQYVTNYLKQGKKLGKAYTYELVGA